MNQIVDDLMQRSVGRFAGRITRVEVHLNDLNGGKHGERDKRCMMEARLAGLAPVAVSDAAPRLAEAIKGAADKLQHAIERVLGRQHDGAGRSPMDQHVAAIEDLETLESQEKHRRR
jgi:hypothetical protein